MTTRIGLAVVVSCALAVAASAQDSVQRTPWEIPISKASGPMRRRPAAASSELAAKEFFTPEEAAQFQRTRIEQTNADRPLPPGQVGAYNDVFFERGTSIVRSRRTSLSSIHPTDASPR